MFPTGRRSMYLAAAFALLMLAQCPLAWASRLFSDSFDRPSLGSQWKAVDDPSPAGGPSDWRIDKGALVQTSNIYRSDKEYDYWQGTHVVAGSSDWRNYVLSAEVTSSDDDGWGLIVRYQDSGNYYRFITVRDSGNGGPFCRLEKFVDGKRTVLAEEKKAFEVGKPVLVKLAAKEGKLALWLDDKISISASDKTFDSGKVGFLAYANSGMAIRNVVVESFDGETAPVPPVGTDVSFSDGFDRKEIGPEWTVVDDAPGPSHWFVTGGALRQDSNIYRGGDEYTWFQGSHIVAGKSDWRDYRVSVQVKSDDDDGWGVLLRYNSPKEYYRFVTVADSGNRGPFMRLEKLAGDKPVLLAEEKSAFVPGKECSVEFSASGDRLEVRFDGKLVLQARDSALKSGRFGFMAYANSGVSFRNVSVRKVE